MGISWYRTSFGTEEIAQFADAVHNEHLGQGPITEMFEKKISEKLNVPYAVATTSGSVALLMSMMALDIKPDDEIIIPNRTWIATAHAPLILGAKVKLVDSIPEIPIMNVSQIKNKITKKTKAIIPVHLNGRSEDMIEINKIAKEYGLKVVEDACQSFGSRNLEGYLGTQSDMGCFSLGVAKLMSTGQGGVIVTKNPDLYRKLKSLRSHGTTTNIDPVYNSIGCNFKFTDLLASVGIAQFSKLEEKISHVKKIHRQYEDGLNSIKGINIVPVNISSGEVPLFVEAMCENRPDIEKFLSSKDINTRPYLPNISSAPYIKSEEKFPNSKIFAEQGIFLPCGPTQPLENVEKVISTLRDYRK